MLLRIIFFVVITTAIILMLLYINKPEHFTTTASINNLNIDNSLPEEMDNGQIYLNGSVHLNGKIYNQNNPNRIKVDRICFRKNFGDTVKEECIDGETLSYVMNNTDERNYLKCLDDVCIGKKHFDILRDEANFKIKNNDKCYMRRDATFHGLGGNYNSLPDTSTLNSMDNNINGIHRLRRGWYKWGDRSPGPWVQSRYRENMPGKKHDDGGQYFWGYKDGYWRNQPYIPNFVVGENCDEENDSLFGGHLNTQKKNHFRFIKTEFEDTVPIPPSIEDGVVNTGNEPEPEPNAQNVAPVDAGLSVGN